MTEDEIDLHLTPVTEKPHYEIEPKDDLPDSIIDRLHAAMREMPPVAKTGTGETKNKKTGEVSRWSYLEDRVLTPEARRIAIRNGLHATFKIRDVEKMGQYSEKTVVKWDVDVHGVNLTEASLKFRWASEGQDYGDKGISKAVTSARKDFWRTQLMVSGGPENEADTVESPETPITPAQKRELKNLVETAEEQGYDVEVLPMPETSAACDDLIAHLEDITTTEFQTGKDLEEDDD